MGRGMMPESGMPEEACDQRSGHCGGPGGAHQCPDVAATSVALISWKCEIIRPLSFDSERAAEPGTSGSTASQPQTCHLLLVL
jgi:hypothetical protein